MRFLFPEFLFALLAVLIPVLIHLFNFRKFRKVYFSNVSFLKEIQIESSSARKLKNRLLLVCRVLAIVFLVLAFAQPYLAGEGGSGVVQSQTVVSVYIDNSYSMELHNPEGSLLEEAKRRAREIASAHSINDRFQLITNDLEGRHQRLVDYETFLSAIDEVKISALSRRVDEITRRQEELLQKSPGATKNVYLISDFQKNMLSTPPQKRDSSINYHLVKIRAAAESNVSVDSLWFISPVHRPGESERLVVRIKNNSEAKVDNVPLKLLVDGQQKALGTLSLGPRGIQTDTLSFSGSREGWRRAEVSITDYPVTFDDRFLFTFHVRALVPVLVVNSNAPSKYLEALYKAEPSFSVREYKAGNINYAEISNYSFIIVNGTEFMTVELAEQLKRYVENGGHLMIYPDLTPGLAGLRLLTQKLGIDVPQSINTDPARVGSVSLTDPLFKGVFEKLPRNPDLPVASKYVMYSRSNRSGKNEIMTFQGGRAFINRYSLGKGKILLSAVPLDEEASNLVRHSFFVPLMYQSVFLSLQDKPLAYTIGQDAFIQVNRVFLSANQILKMRAGDVEIIPEIRQTEEGTRLFVADQVREQAYYEIVKGDSLIAVAAFNDNRRESDLSFSSEKDLEQYFGGGKTQLFDPSVKPLKNSIEAARDGVQLWKLCLALSLICLFLEILVLKYYDRQNARTKH